MIHTLPPSPASQSGRAAFQALRTHKSLLPALQALRDDLGDAFLLSFPGFKAIVLSGPEAARFTYVERRDALRWRTEDDPVTGLLRHGLLVEDGESHRFLRQSMMPHLHRQKVAGYLDVFLDRTDQLCVTWDLNQPLDMLVEMRRLALLILMETLFEVDLAPDMDRLWPAILQTIKFISPGAWLVWRGLPRPGYGSRLRELDRYIYDLIAIQRRNDHSGRGLLQHMINLGMDDGLIRDQILTLLIAGHDTSTALLAWTIYLLSGHPDAMQRVQQEVDAEFGGRRPRLDGVERLQYLDQVIKETLRLYPPIHVSNRHVMRDLEFKGYSIPCDYRLMLSIYLTHHDREFWPDPERFDPSRFAPGVSHPPYAYIPFGGGPRNCIGAAYAQLEAKVVLARLLQSYTFTLLQPNIRLYMGATLEPRPGVLVKVTARQ